MTDDEPTVIEWIAPAPQDQWCWVCGARRGKGDSDDAWTVDRNLGESPRGVKVDGGRATAPEPAWSRRHTSCLPVAWYLIEQVSGESLDGLTRSDVETIRVDTDVYLSALAADWTGRRPWGWVGDSDRGRLRVAIERARRSHTPQPHPSGRCGSCGVAKSIGWERLPSVAFLDGTGAYGCSTCAPAIRAAGSLEDDDVRLAALGVLAGVAVSRQMLPLARQLKLFARVANYTEVHDDAAAAWRYRPEPLARLAERTRLQHPDRVVDPRRRALAERHLQALRAAAAEADRRGDDDSVDSGW